MRRTALLMLSCLLTGSAAAAENFIPKGHLYAPDGGKLPALNSSQSRFNQQADIYEAENDAWRRDRKVFDSRLNRFFYEQELPGGDFTPDY